MTRTTSTPEGAAREEAAAPRDVREAVPEEQQLLHDDAQQHDTHLPALERRILQAHGLGDVGAVGAVGAAASARRAHAAAGGRAGGRWNGTMHGRGRRRACRPMAQPRVTNIMMTYASAVPHRVGCVMFLSWLFGPERKAELQSEIMCPTVKVMANCVGSPCRSLWKANVDMSEMTQPAMKQPQKQYTRCLKVRLGQ